MRVVEEKAKGVTKNPDGSILPFVIRRNKVLTVSGYEVLKEEPQQMFGIHAYSGPLGGTAGEEKAEEFDKKLSELVRKTIRQIGSKTFYVKADGTWVDSAYDEKDKAKIKEVKLWSDEFFDLVKNHPEIGRVLAETQELIICVGGQIYRVGYQDQE